MLTLYIEYSSIRWNSASWLHNRQPSRYFFFLLLLKLVSRINVMLGFHIQIHVGRQFPCKPPFYLLLVFLNFLSLKIIEVIFQLIFRELLEDNGTQTWLNSIFNSQYEFLMLDHALFQVHGIFQLGVIFGHDEHFMNQFMNCKVNITYRLLFHVISWFFQILHPICIYEFVNGSSSIFHGRLSSHESTFFFLLRSAFESWRTHWVFKLIGWFLILWEFVV